MIAVIEKINSLLRSPQKNIVAGIWTEESELLKAAKAVKDKGYKCVEAVSPYPLHDIDGILKIPRSSIPWVTFTFGLLGFIFGVWLTWWVSAVSWPLNIGGKPMWSLAAFIPVIFELTILFGALSSVAALIYLCGLPKVDPPVIDEDLTSHKFALFISDEDPNYNAAEISKVFQSLGSEKVLETKW